MEKIENEKILEMVCGGSGKKRGIKRSKTFCLKEADFQCVNCGNTWKVGYYNVNTKEKIFIAIFCPKCGYIIWVKNFKKK